MLSTVVLSDLFVMLAYCGQTVGWIKMKLGTEIGLGPGHIVLDGDPQPPRNRQRPKHTFRPMSVVAKRSPISATAEHLLRTYCLQPHHRGHRYIFARD